MQQAPDETLSAFGALYPDIPAAEIHAADECFRRYVQLAIEIAQLTATAHLTDTNGGGTVSTGKVDPTRTFTNTG